MAKASAVRAAASRAWRAAANPDGPGALEPGREFAPTPVDNFDPLVVALLVRLARLSDEVADALRECPDPRVRGSAAVLAARAHPIRAAFDAV